MGDFGYVSEGLDDREMLSTHKIGRQLITNNKIVVGSAPLSTVNIMETKARD